MLEYMLNKLEVKQIISGTIFETRNEFVEWISYHRLHYRDIKFFVILHNHIEHLRREAVVASSRLTYKLMDTLNTG